MAGVEWSVLGPLARGELLKEDAVVFIHDWCRKRYRRVLENFEIIQEIDSKDLDSGGIVALKLK